MRRHFLPFGLCLLMAACSSQPQDPLAGLSEKERRAAEAHANNLCLMANKPQGTAADQVAGIGDLAVGMDQGDPNKIIEAANAIARDKGCVSKNPSEQQTQPAVAPAPTPASPNTHVSDNLNAADGMFRGGMDGCPSVSVAIAAANAPSIYGPTTPAQRAELKPYADRCKLRFQP
jgi:hypothetical protein